MTLSCSCSVHKSLWLCAVHVCCSLLCAVSGSTNVLPQVQGMSTVSVPSTPDITSKQATESARFSLFSHFPVSNGGASCSALGGLQASHAEQPKSAGYQLFGSTNPTFPSVSPLLPVSLY